MQTLTTNLPPTKPANIEEAVIAAQITAKASKPKAPRKTAKATGKVRKAKANGKAKRGGGKALPDFANTAKLRVLKAKEIPQRRNCFRTGQTVAQNLALQKKAGFKGRRKFIRKQIAQKRIALS